MNIKLKYILLAFTLIGMIAVWKVGTLLLMPIGTCIILYVVYTLHSKIKRKKSLIFSTLRG